MSLFDCLFFKCFVKWGVLFGVMADVTGDWGHLACGDICLVFFGEGVCMLGNTRMND